MKARSRRVLTLKVRTRRELSREVEGKMRFAGLTLTIALSLGAAGSSEAGHGAVGKESVKRLTGTVVRVYRELGYVVVEDYQGNEHNVRLSENDVRVRNRRASGVQARAGDTVHVRAGALRL